MLLRRGDWLRLTELVCHLPALRVPLFPVLSLTCTALPTLLTLPSPPLCRHTESDVRISSRRRVMSSDSSAEPSSAAAATPAADAAAVDAPSSSPSPSPYSNPSGPSVLILGGCGFLARHLVVLLATRRLVRHVWLADKTLPQLANLLPQQRAIYDDKQFLTFKQADLTKEAHIARVFGSGQSFDIVFNLCGETRVGLSEVEYRRSGVEAASRCAKAAASMHPPPRRWVEVSSGAVYAPTRDKSDEGAKLKPWTMQAQARLEAEQAVRAVSGLNVVVLRPAIVYGQGDLTGLTPRMACAAVYRASGEKMRFLWNEELRINTVHVEDVAQAMWVAATECAPGSVYNLADSSDVSQGTLNSWLSSLFGIETSFLGSLVSSLARLNLKGVAADANDKHVPGFTQLCAKHHITHTPVSAYIDAELLREQHLSLDGSRITRDTSFRYTKQATPETVREQLDTFIQQGLFPPIS